MSKCRSCDARMNWVTNADTGNPVPLDTLAVDNGVFVLGATGFTVSHIKNFTDAEVEAARESKRLFLPHHATCPNRDQHRRARR